MALEAFRASELAAQVQEPKRNVQRKILAHQANETPGAEQMSLTDALDDIRSAPVPPNEETAKLQILVPILQKLGWSLTRQEIVFEYVVNGGRIDIALCGSDRIVAFIEAKAPSVDLDRHVAQVVKYAFAEGVDICVLSNGMEWRLYLPMQRGVRFEERQFATLRTRKDPLEQLQYDLEAFLSKTNLVDGTAQQLAEQRWTRIRRDEALTKAIPETWRRMLTEPDQDLIDLVGQRIDEQTALQPTREEVESTLEPFLVPYNPQPPTPQPPRPKPLLPPPPTPDPDFKRKPSGIRLWGKYLPVSSWTRVLLLVLEGLHDRHGADAFEQVLSRLVTRRRATLSRPVQVGVTGFWINRSIPIAEIHRRSYASLKAFGHPSTDLETIYD